MGYAFRENDILGLFISYSLKKSCKRNQRARVVQQWEHSPPTNMAWVQFPALMPYAGWVCCWFFHLRWKIFLQVLWFSPLLKKTLSNFKSIRNQVDYVDVLPLNHYLFFYLNVYLFITRILTKSWKPSSRLCSSNARWPLVPNVCSWVTAKS